MNFIISIIYLSLMILTCLFIVKDRKNINKRKNNFSTNTKDKKIAILIILFVTLFYYLLGYILKTDILNVVTFKKHHVSFSFIGLILLLITSLAISVIIEFINKKKSRN